MPTIGASTRTKPFARADATAGSSCDSAFGGGDRNRREALLGRPPDRHAHAGLLDRHLADAGLLDDADDLADPFRA